MRVANDDLMLVDGEPADGDLSFSTVFKPQYLGHIASFSIQIFFTGTPVGAFKLQASNDPGHPMAAGDSLKYATVTHWSDISGTQVNVTTAGDVFWDVQNSGYEWVRVKYTAVSGAGDVTSARCKVKGI
jgi:hypothetical protein